MKERIIPYHDIIGTTTSLPKQITNIREFQEDGLYKDHIVFGHALCSFLGNNKRCLILDCQYGIIAQSLVDNNHEILLTDLHEDNYDTILFKKYFRTANYFLENLSLLKEYDFIISMNFESETSNINIDNFSNFCLRHNCRSVILLFIENIKIKEYISSFKKNSFHYDMDFIYNLRYLLIHKCPTLNLFNLHIFTREQNHAWSCEEA